MAHLATIIICCILLVVSVFIPAPSETMTFLDVGQGDSILLQDGAAQVLIDGGPGKAVLARLSEELPYFDRTIEVVIATHPDRDHLEGLLHVLEKYPVKLVILPPIPHTSQLQDEWLNRLIQAITAKKIAYRFAEAGQDLVVGEMKITILSPPVTDTFLTGKTNNASVITRVASGELSLLLTGDAEAGIERDLIARSPGNLDIDVLKAGHHGSKTSTSPELLQATTPQLVVISVGQGNSYGHPHPSILERIETLGARVVRTDEVGSIRFIQQGEGWLVYCGKQSLFTPTPNRDRCLTNQKAPK